MIKVYLDWNCITHSKDKFSKLKDLLEQYSGLFICPYSEAHLRDVQTNFNANPVEYEKDLDLLTEICRTHLILLTNGELRLLCATPKEYLKDSGDVLDYIQNSFKFPYSEIRGLIQKTIPHDILHRISIENSPNNVIPMINSIIKNNTKTDDDLDALLKRAKPSGQNNLEERIKGVYYALDMMGYKKESDRKSFANIDTDAQHVAIASMCDYFISDDKKLRSKATSIYSSLGCVTKVMDVTSFIEIIPTIADECYKEDLIPYAMQNMGFPTMKEDGAHIKALDYPLFGAFKFCYNANALDNSMPSNISLFMPGTFMFYDELLPLAKITTIQLPDELKQAQIDNYIQSYKQSKPIERFTFVLISQKYEYECTLLKYDGLPALRVKYTERLSKKNVLPNSPI